MDSHHQDREESQASPVKKGGFPPPHTHTPTAVSSPTPLTHRLSLHAGVGSCGTTRPDTSRADSSRGDCGLRFQEHQCSRTPQAPGVEPLSGQPQLQRRPHECLCQAATPLAVRAPTGGRDSFPRVQTRPGPYLKGQRHLCPNALAVAVAVVTAPSAVTPLIKTTTCSEASAAGRRWPAGRRSACWDSQSRQRFISGSSGGKNYDSQKKAQLAAEKLGQEAASLTTSGPRRWRGAAPLPVVMETGYYNHQKGFSVSSGRTVLYIMRIGLYILIQLTVHLLFAALIGCSKKAAYLGRLLAFLPSAAGKDCVCRKNKEDIENDRV